MTRIKLSQSSIGQIHLTANLLVRRFNQILLFTGLNYNQYIVMNQVEQSSLPVTQSEVVKILGISRPAMNRLIVSLKERQFMYLVVNSKNKTQKFLRLSKKGKQLVMEANQKILGYLENITSSLAQNTTEELKQTLADIRKKI